jgi:hypothetical protein
MSELDRRFDGQLTNPADLYGIGPWLIAGGYAARWMADRPAPPAARRQEDRDIGAVKLESDAMNPYSYSRRYYCRRRITVGTLLRSSAVASGCLD